MEYPRLEVISMEFQQAKVELERLLLGNMHVMTIVLNGEGTVCRSIRYYVFRESREWISFQFIVRTVKETKLMVVEDIGEPKKGGSSAQFYCALSGAKH